MKINKNRVRNTSIYLRDIHSITLLLCFMYHFVVFFFLQQHNYRVTTSTRTGKRSIYINCSIFNNSYLDWCFYCDCSCCSCAIMLLFICHCASTITYEEEQNDIVTTTKTTTTTHILMYINCEIFLFTLVLLLLCHVVVFLVQLELLIHNHKWTRRITTFNSNNNKGESVYICLSNAFSIVCTEETFESSSL